jgi:hypothetical protein
MAELTATEKSGPRMIARNGHRLKHAGGAWWTCIRCHMGFKGDLTGEPDVLGYRDARGREFRKCPVPAPREA